MLPGAQIMTAVTGFDDRNMLNQCLLYRYVISYEPYHFKGRLDDFPLTMAYGKKVDGLRAELRSFLWEGEYRGTVGAKVTENGKAHHPYTVFRHRDAQSLCVAVANYDADKPISVDVALDSGDSLTHYRIVSESDWKHVEATTAIPPRSAAVYVTFIPIA